MLEKHGIASDMMHGQGWSKWTTGTPVQRLQLIPAGQEFILEQEDGKKRFVQVVMELSRAFALCAASDEAVAIRDDVFSAARLPKPDIPMLPAYLQEEAVKTVLMQAELLCAGWV